MSQNQFDSIREAYEHFIEEVLGTEIVWGLSDGENWATCESEDFEGREVIPFWSNENFAKLLCTDDWSVYQPTPIRFDEFIDDWLHGMAEDEVMVGINWDEELVGPELEPIWVMDDLLEE